MLKATFMKLQISISTAFTKGQTVLVRKGKDWKLGVVQLSSATTVRVKMTDGTVTMVDAKDVKPVPIPTGEKVVKPKPVKPPSDPIKPVAVAIAPTKPSKPVNTTVVATPGKIPTLVELKKLPQFSHLTGKSLQAAVKQYHLDLVLKSKDDVIQAEIASRHPDTIKGDRRGNIEKALRALDIEDKGLLNKLVKIPHVIAIGLMDSGSAGFFIFGGDCKARTPPKFADGTTVTAPEFFNLMRAVGGGLKGPEGKPFDLCKGSALSRIEPNVGVSNGIVMKDGFRVPAGWTQYYTKKFKIPLNLFSTTVQGDTRSVGVYYIAKKPVY
jgi:hypothetical protein